MNREKNNGINVEKKKIFIQYNFVLTMSVLLGIMAAFLTKDGALLSAGERIRTHFAVDIPDANTVYNTARAVLRYSVPDIICIVGAFCFTFSIVSYLASDIILIYEGFTVGFAAAEIYRYISIFDNLSISKFIWFVGFKSAFLIFILSFIYGLAVHALDMKEFNSVYRVKLNFGKLVFLLMYSAVGLGTAILLNTVYCLGIFIL